MPSKDSSKAMDKDRKLFIVNLVYYGFLRFLIFLSVILLTLGLITAPMNKDASWLSLHLQNSSTVTLGNYGYCILDTASGADLCTYDKHYHPANIAEMIVGPAFDHRVAAELFHKPRTPDIYPAILAVAACWFVNSLLPGFWSTGMASIWLIVIPSLGLATEKGHWRKILEEVNKSTIEVEARIPSASKCWSAGYTILLITEYLWVMVILIGQQPISYKGWICCSNGYRKAPQEDGEEAIPLSDTSTSQDPEDHRGSDVESLPPYSSHDSLQATKTTSNVN